MKTGRQIINGFRSAQSNISLEAFIDNEIKSLVNEVSRLNILISAARKHGEDSESPFYEMMKLLNGEKK